jgi:hypothetical protein
VLRPEGATVPAGRPASADPARRGIAGAGARAVQADRRRALETVDSTTRNPITLVPFARMVL